MNFVEKYYSVSIEGNKDRPTLFLTTDGDRTFMSKSGQYSLGLFLMPFNSAIHWVDNHIGRVPSGEYHVRGERIYISPVKCLRTGEDLHAVLEYHEDATSRTYKPPVKESPMTLPTAKMPTPKELYVVYHNRSMEVVRKLFTSAISKYGPEKSVFNNGDVYLEIKIQASTEEIEAFMNSERKCISGWLLTQGWAIDKIAGENYHLIGRYL